MDNPVNRIDDPEVRLLAGLGAALQRDYVSVEHDPWKDSPFDWIRGLASRSKGAIGEQLVAGWCAAKGFDVTAAGDSDADRIIAGQRVEIKLSTLWKTGDYKSSSCATSGTRTSSAWASHRSTRNAGRFRRL